ncbi:hypothetical protein AM202_01210 [Actinobacillus minor 202]|uniref:Lipoprotein n=1 Tax=Actinobacillus minor 202 TaxID=591023 RepID=A0ABM9YTW7_9PAST|nr:hypothetical protein [Actinobacillus minor]EEV24800.1 hypothetical protein AM202_01210 [Actinobacillus minor 202]
MHKKGLLAAFLLSSLLIACSNGDKVAVVDTIGVNQVGATNTHLQDQQIHFSEGNVTGKTTYQSSTPVVETKNNTPSTIPEKATAICNDGTFSMSLLNEACLNNGGVKTAISRYQSN